MDQHDASTTPTVFNGPGDGELAETDPSITTASHDLPVPERLAEFMRTGWAEPPTAASSPAPSAAYTAERRARLAERFPGETLVIPSGTAKVRNNDSSYEFRPGSDFAWLTTCYEQDAVLVAGPDGATLYVRVRASRESDEFFRSRGGELWVGPRRSAEEWSTVLGLPCVSLDALPKVVAELDPATTRVLRGHNAELDATLAAPDDGLRDGQLAAALGELRLVKDAWEIEQLRDAVDATVRGFSDVVRALPADRESSERLVDGVFGLRARHDGNTVGYGTIAAAGAHACTLHWWRNDGVCRPGELVLLDAGVENRHLYTADITRTVPVSGRFSPVQRRVYETVLAAQEAGIAVIRPGVVWRDIHRACMRVIAGALADWGLLPVSAAESLDDEVGLHRRWTLHASGHMLGLDVHDCAKARSETYLDGVLATGQALTVEPGLYFQPDDLTVPEEYRGIGVRIEDDVLVTDDGAEVLSAALPRDPDAVEAWMAAERAAGLRLPG
ncbi:aminopeptidase P family protein [Cryptosporangium aurantiacum]|uniref:Xaa-Pro aminopeptidase n=1 Tax=Cryptosporangium aurantiacum TaxID=134849 RepID=A0A1M7JAR8_9ACTN|nr:aminopeptidase P family protein [Cryptosporangium aurantiacum]SHM49973.1 Xaa-Pro aminopeptidase [Cryptosporangium aurantiacum]